MHLDVICIIHTVVFFLFRQYFFETGWALKKEKKKKKHRLSNFYNWLFICILYQWSFLYWELKKKNLYWKKLSGLSMWPRLDQVLSLASWWCQAIFCCFCLLSLIRCLILSSLHVPHFVNQFQFRGGWDPLKSW